MKFWRIVIWLILFFTILNISLNMISERNTVENVIGLLLFAADLYFSVITKCLTTINISFKKENKIEENEKD